MASETLAHTVLSMTRNLVLSTIFTAAILLTGCSQDTIKSITENAVESGLLVAAETIAKQLDGRLNPDGKLPVELVQEVLSVYGTLFEVSFQDADGDGFVDRNRVQISTNGVSACVRIKMSGTKVSSGVCPSP